MTNWLKLWYLLFSLNFLDTKMQNETGSYPLLYFCPLFENITTSIPGHLFSDITSIRPIYHQTYLNWIPKHGWRSISNWIEKIVEIHTRFELKKCESWFVIHFVYFTKNFFLILLKFSHIIRSYVCTKYPVYQHFLRIYVSELIWTPFRFTSFALIFSSKNLQKYIFRESEG